MKKSLFLALLAFVLVFFASCETPPLPNPEESTADTSAPSMSEEATTHEHSYTENKTEPTCTEAGKYVLECACGDVITEELAALGHSMSGWTVELAATCKDAGKRASVCSKCGEKVEEAIPAGESSLDGKKVMFAGNSLTYYGEVVINNDGSPTRNKGVFEKIAESFGDKVKVTNFTYGSAGFTDGRDKASADGIPTSYKDYGLYQLMTELHPNYYNNKNGKEMDSFYDQDVVIFQQRGASISSSYDQVKQIAALFPEDTRFAVIITHYDTKNSSTTGSSLKKTLADGWTVIPAGDLVTDLWNGRLTGMEFKYTKTDFVITKDDVHPNYLTGYIKALMTYCALTGRSAAGADYSFVNRSTSYYANAQQTQFEDVLASSSEMLRIQELIDSYIVKAGNEPSGAHSYTEWKQVSAPTCTKAGERSRECSVCGKKESVTLTVPHTYGDWKVLTAATSAANGTKERSCTLCGAKDTKEYTFNLLYGKSATKAESFGLSSISNPANQTDGKYVYDKDAKSTYTDFKMSFSKAECVDYTSISQLYNAKGQLAADGKYLCGFYFELDEAAFVDSFSLYNSGVTYDIDGFDILVSTDGENWTVAWSGEKLASGLKYEKADATTNKITASFDKTEAKFVMFALTAPRSRDASGVAAFNDKYGVVAEVNANPHYFRIVEFELYESN
jgi:hypothetical protein